MLQFELILKQKLPGLSGAFNKNVLGPSLFFGLMISPIFFQELPKIYRVLPILK